MKISRMLAGGELLPLRRGLYLRDRAVDPISLASAIYGPSYISYESALAWHGLIPEKVGVIISATLKRPADFENPVGYFRYHHVPVRVFSVGIERVDDPTKALCDSVARDASIRSQKDVCAWLESMRIDALPLIDREQLTACASSYGSPAVRHLARYFKKNPTSS